MSKNVPNPVEATLWSLSYFFMSKKELCWLTNVFFVGNLENASTIHWEDALAKVSVTFKWQGFCSPDGGSRVVEQLLASIRSPQKENTTTGNLPSGWKLTFPAGRNFLQHVLAPNTCTRRSAVQLRTQGQSPLVPAKAVSGVELQDRWHIEVWPSNELVGNKTDALQWLNSSGQTTTGERHNAGSHSQNKPLKSTHRTYCSYQYPTCKLKYNFFKILI